MTIDVTTEARRVEAEIARRADLDSRHESRSLTMQDRAEAEARRSAKGWGPYRAETTKADLAAARENRPDPRRVPIQRMWIDTGRAAGRWAPRFKRDDRETLRTDALLWILRRDAQGSGSEAIDLGPVGSLPLRRDWLADDGQPTPRAWRALHAAIRAAVEAPGFRGMIRERETVSVADSERDASAIDIGATIDASAMAQSERVADADVALSLPDADAPEVLAELLSVSLDAARAITARAHPALSPAELALAWNCKPSSVAVALSRGAKQVLKRWPDSCDLLDALADASDRYALQVEATATLALAEYRAGETTRERAELAVAQWRRSSAGIPAHRLALLTAARRAAERRKRGAYGSARAERVALSVARLIPAEARRARRTRGASNLRLAPMQGDSVSLARAEAIAACVKRQSQPMRREDPQRDACARSAARALRRLIAEARAAEYARTGAPIDARWLPA